MRRAGAWPGAVLAASIALAQERPQAQAVRVAPGSIRLDGRLDESIWRDAPAITELTQRDPAEGARASDAVAVRFAYDADALFVGARLFGDPKSLQGPLGRRDDSSKTEYLVVYLDTWLDRRTAVAFGVTVAGARLDLMYPRDDTASADLDFNPVWEARTRVDSEGWTAEMRIPFSQLRFNRGDAVAFGLNVQRYVPTRNEDAFWVLVPKNAAGWASRFGDLSGLAGVSPVRRIELSPYAAGALTRTRQPAPGDPFDDGSRAEARAGLDAKLGIGPNLNVDLTLNPDFGQVEADPAEVNLTAFETIFKEKRPFFIEGAGILASEWGNYYYSRRIGARPRGEVDAEFTDYPRAATILGAAKLTGRFASGTSVGGLLAVTDRESARTFTTDDGRSRVDVAPLALYAISRVQQELGSAGSTVGLMTAAVHRDLDPADPLAQLYARNAYTGGADWRLRFRDSEYEVSGYLGGAHVDGEKPAIERLQRSSARYFQRPDAEHVELDPERTSLNGYGYLLRVDKIGGKHWLGHVATTAESPGLEQNDAGRIITADGRVLESQLIYRETRPGLLQNWRVLLGNDNEWNFDGDRQESAIRLTGVFKFRNFWQLIANGNWLLRCQDQRLTRGGPSMARAEGWSSWFNVSSNPSTPFNFNVGASRGGDDDGGTYWDAGGGIAWRAGPRFSLSIDLAYTRETVARQYVDTFEGGRAETYGSRYVFGYVDRTTLLFPLRAGFAFTPDLTLDLYAEPFAASGRYFGIGELLRPRTSALLTYGTAGTTIVRDPGGSYTVTDGGASFSFDDPDFDVRSFRSTLVLRWEWRRGSILHLVWQQDRLGEEARPRRASFGDALGAISADGTRTLLLKASFWLPVP